MKRKFSSKRLFRLSTIIVILVTIFCVFGFWYNVKVYHEYQNKWSAGFDTCYTEYWNFVDSGKPSNISKWNWRTKHENDPVALQQLKGCMAEPNVNSATSTTAGNTADVDFDIAILLPLLYFCGMGLYKFLFPKIKNNTK